MDLVECLIALRKAPEDVVVTFLADRFPSCQRLLVPEDGVPEDQMIGSLFDDSEMTAAILISENFFEVSEDEYDIEQFNMIRSSLKACVVRLVKAGLMNQGRPSTLA
jgi:hypothetical protein